MSKFFYIFICRSYLFAQKSVMSMNAITNCYFVLFAISACIYTLKFYFSTSLIITYDSSWEVFPKIIFSYSVPANRCVSPL